MVPRVLIARIAGLAACGAIAGCYDPHSGDCELRCGGGGACPGELACDGEGFCRTPGAMPACSEIIPDAAGAADARADAAPPGDARGNCTVAPPAPAPCAPAIILGDRCYAKCTEYIDWATARATCEGAGGYLVTFELMTENTAVVAALVPPGTGVSWIGLRQIIGQGQPNQAWSWITTGDLLYTNWYATEPNDSDGTENDQEDCGVISWAGGGNRDQWADTPCNGMRPYLCEW